VLKLSEKALWNLTYCSWLIALVGTAGSLYFSEVLDFAPCVLCWFQRIALYPLTIITIVGLLRKDLTHVYYVAPISLIGTAIAVYHSLLFYGVISPELSPCREGVSCTERQLEGFGFISIPLMSAGSFLTIFALSVVVILGMRKPSV